MRSATTELTAREREEHEQQKELIEMQGGYNLKLKEMEIAILTMEAKWSAWLRLPAMIILLPVKFIMAFAIPISVITKKELPEAFWDFMRG